ARRRVRHHRAVPGRPRRGRRRGRGRARVRSLRVRRGLRRRRSTRYRLRLLMQRRVRDHTGTTTVSTSRLIVKDGPLVAYYEFTFGDAGPRTSDASVEPEFPGGQVSGASIEPEFLWRLGKWCFGRAGVSLAAR